MAARAVVSRLGSELRREWCRRDPHACWIEAERVLGRTRNTQRIAEVERALREARQELTQALERVRERERQQVERRRIDGQLRAARASCPDVGRLKADHERARQRRVAARDDVRRVRRELAARWVRPPHVQRLRGQARAAEVDFVRSRERHDASVDLYLRLQEDLRRTPPTVERPVHAVHQNRIRAWTRQCQAEATVRLDGESQSASENLAVHTKTRDESHAAYAPAGLVADPKAYPRSDGDLVSGLDRELQGAVDEKLEAILRDRRGRLISGADRASSADPKLALRDYLRGWMSEPGRPAPAGLVRLVRAQYGIDAKALAPQLQGLRNPSGGR